MIRVLVLAAVLLAGCNIQTYKTVSGQVTAIRELPDGTCAVDVQALGGITMDQGTVIVACADAHRVLPGEYWPPR